MKTKRLLIAIAMFLFGIANVFAGSKSEIILVNGKCEMCEKRIEMAALSLTGASKADWNKENKELTLVFDESKSSIMKIHEAVATVGHDTKLVNAPAEVYEKLPSCCKYDRSKLKAVKKPTNHVHK